ncbi:MAG: 3-deoxy-D-manno-octulosonic acid transferase [Proteobacteria bacterium]|nr:3-deoxy-D-manno-octulosonic acid transferase [Pseudomonadota bacterium]
MILRLYRLLVQTLVPLILLVLWVRARRGHEETAHLKERRGIPSLPKPNGKILWVHAASVGEMRSVLPLVQTLIEKNEDLTCLITTVTVTAARLVRKAEHQRIIHQYAPYDHPHWVERFLKYWQPMAVLWVESELWPNGLQAIKARQVPLIMINGRLSARSADRWKRVPKTIRHILSHFDLCLAQSEEDGERLKILGAPRVVVAGNMKYAGKPLLFDEQSLEILRSQIGLRPTVLYASTHPGEEALAVSVHQTLAAQHPELLSIILPRHPKRGEDVAAIVDKEGLRYARRSRGDALARDVSVYVADTLGETGLFYRLCPVVFLGNSMVSIPGGGHNPIEPAQLGCAMVYGPHMWNFAEIDKELRIAGGSLLVRDEKNLQMALHTLLTDEAKRKVLSEAARAFVARQNGVLDGVLALLRPLLERAKISV